MPSRWDRWGRAMEENTHRGQTCQFMAFVYEIVDLLYISASPVIDLVRVRARYGNAAVLTLWPTIFSGYE